jgi:hypothetical protein
MHWRVALSFMAQLLYFILSFVAFGFWLLAGAGTGARSCVVSLDNSGRAAFTA